MRFVVTGAAGAGKTTVARILAESLDLVYVELDTLYNKPNWGAATAEELREAVQRTTSAASRGWVIDGRYHHLIGYQAWHKADEVVWLDLPLAVILPRLLRRQMARMVRRSRLAHGNVETWRRTVLLLYLSVKRHQELRRTVPKLIESDEFQRLKFVRLRSQSDVDHWLAEQKARR